MNAREKLPIPEKLRAVVGEGVAGRACPRCSNPTLIQAEGCDTCLTCGFSRCG
jgi:ribonucleoside-diphosphate reductase alpha chain